MFYSPFGFGAIYGVIPLLFLAVFILIASIVVKGVAQWSKNNNSPRLTVACVIVDKRTETTMHQTPVAGDASGVHGYHMVTDTSHFVTFQVESGDRIEFAVSGGEYGQLAEGDQGKLTFQGTRYLGFEQKQGEYHE